MRHDINITSSSLSHTTGDHFRNCKRKFAVWVTCLCDRSLTKLAVPRTTEKQLSGRFMTELMCDERYTRLLHSLLYQSKKSLMIILLSVKFQNNSLISELQRGSLNSAAVSTSKEECAIHEHAILVTTIT